MSKTFGEQEIEQLVAKQIVKKGFVLSSANAIAKVIAAFISPDKKMEVIVALRDLSMALKDSSLVLEGKVCQSKNCDGILKYVADFGSPGYGQSWICKTCGKDHIVCGQSVILVSAMDPGEMIFIESDVR